MKVISIEDIRKFKPCYDPSKYLPENWTGTALDILRRYDVSAEDRFWVVLREELLDENTLRLFAVWCVRRVEHLLTDERSKIALDTAERVALGFATKKELNAAWAAAMTAFKDVAEGATCDAARAAVWAADNASQALVWTTAAARAAALAAANDAEGAADGKADMVWDAAWDAAREFQIKQLIKMIN